MYSHNATHRSCLMIFARYSPGYTPAIGFNVGSWRRTISLFNAVQDDKPFRCKSAFQVFDDFDLYPSKKPKSKSSTVAPPKPKKKPSVVQPRSPKVELPDLVYEKSKPQLATLNDSGTHTPAADQVRLVLPLRENVEREFIEYYCLQHSLTVPQPISTEVLPTRHKRRKNRRKVTNMADIGWTTKIVLPKHTTLEGVTIPAIESTAHQLRLSASREDCEQVFVRRLLDIVAPEIFHAFVAATAPFKEKLDIVLRDPVKILINDESVLDQLETSIQNIRDIGAFSSVKSDPQSHADNEFYRHSKHPTNIVRIMASMVPGAVDKSLPIASRYLELINMINNNSVVIVSAETGAGKTTQIPQYLLYHHEQNPETPAPNILITQPRRIAAISIADRVASERGETLGDDSSVGYSVRFKKVLPTVSAEKGSAVFCTTGVLLRRLKNDPSLSSVTHVILDEVHERDLNTDLAMIAILDLIHIRPDLRLILMSATADISLFQNYFKRDKALPPTIHVTGRMFPVTEKYLEGCLMSLNSVGKYRTFISKSRECQRYIAAEAPDQYKMEDEFEKSKRMSCDTPLDLMEALICHVLEKTRHANDAVLVFLPGWAEISGLQRRLIADRFKLGITNATKYRIITLHSSMPQSTQQSVFSSPEPGVRNIILSTNIAETSLTITNIGCVIDSGKMRITTYEPQRRISSLDSVWASQSNIKQRIGRAGRVRSGEYFSIMSSDRLRSLPYSLCPELLRIDLQSAVLMVKALHFPGGDIKSIFRRAPQPPKDSSILHAINSLQALGAIDDNEQMTSIGEIMCEMPCDPWIARMTLSGFMFNCFDPILTLAAVMTSRSVFSFHPEERAIARDSIRNKFGKDTDSDQILSLRAFREWQQSGECWQFSKSNWIHHMAMVDVSRTRAQFYKVFLQYGLIRDTSRGSKSGNNQLLGGRSRNTWSSSPEVISAVLCASLYPNCAQVTGRNVYASVSDHRFGDFRAQLRLDGSSVNAWKYLTRDRSNPTSTEPVLPHRLLSFSERQSVDGVQFMRQTTVPSTTALLLLAGTQTLTWALHNEIYSVLMDRSLSIVVGDRRIATKLREARTYLQKYLDWSVGRSKLLLSSEERALRRSLGDQLVKTVAELLQQKPTPPKNESTE
uniref:RNA helicase n=1 Tax=Spongospora subterranea TaxID=70186 RepID=A0A0H5RPF8_9EUKA|eukprot:CRZ10609.1 hypothetical protein [Spongospora subterranea]